MPLLQLLVLTVDHHVPRRGAEIIMYLDGERSGAERCEAERVRRGACAVRSGQGVRGEVRNRRHWKELVSERTEEGVLTKWTPLPAGDRGQVQSSWWCTTTIPSSCVVSRFPPSLAELRPPRTTRFARCPHLCRHRPCARFQRGTRAPARSSADACGCPHG